jgi:succinoglycan biosynthesis transport protein ExoP
MTVLSTRDQTPQIARALPGQVRRPGGAVGAAEPGMSGRDILRVIRKRKWLISISLVICVLLSVLAWLGWLEWAPLYKAYAVMEVRPQLATALVPTRGEVAQDIIDSIARTQANLIRSRDVLDAAVQSDRIRNTQWFQRDRDNAVRRLRDEIDVSPVPETKLVQISMSAFDTTGSEKRELPEIVNAVAAAAERDSQETASLGKQAQIGQLRAQRTSLVDQRDRVRGEKAKLLRDADVPNMLERRNVLTEKLHSLAPTVTGAEIDYAQADSQVQVIKEQIKNGQIASNPRILQVMEYDYSLRTLRATLLNLRTTLESARQKLGPRHRTVVTLGGRAASMEDELKQREKALVDRQAQGLLANAEITKALSLQRLTQLREQYRFVDVSVRELQATINAFSQRDSEEKALSDSIDRIGNRLVDLNILLKGDAPLVLRRAARIPIEPEQPRGWLMIPLGVVLGLLIGFGLAFLLEFVDTSIRGPADVTRRVDLPLLGMVPHEDDVEEDIPDLRMAFSSHPNSLMGEAFRQVRTCLMFSGPPGQRRSLLVTSPLPEDGRTTVALNLAAAIARDGKKVLVIDANFRQPALQQLFSRCPEAGLSSVLVGQGNWQEMTAEVEPNLNVISSGPMPPNPAELLGSEQMRAALDEMVKAYDQVIFDGAPCLLVNDAASLSALVDRVVLVVRAGSNTYGIVQRVREMLAGIGAHLVGVVLNGVRTVAGGYLRKNYDAFYEYQERAQLPQK